LMSCSVLSFAGIGRLWSRASVVCTSSVSHTH
jgi:hypothetical protein